MHVIDDVGDARRIMQNLMDDWRCPYLDAWQLATFATSCVKIFSTKFGAREVCIAPQSRISPYSKSQLLAFLIPVFIPLQYQPPIKNPAANYKSQLSAVLSPSVKNHNPQFRISTPDSIWKTTKNEQTRQYLTSQFVLVLNISKVRFAQIAPSPTFFNTFAWNFQNIDISLRCYVCRPSQKIQCGPID